MPHSAICCDASLIVRLVQKSSSGLPQARWAQWRRENRTIIAPSLIRFELANAFYRQHQSGVTSLEKCELFLTTSLELPIQIDTDVELHPRALELAMQFNLGAAYDAHYLSTAEKHNAELWTADRKLFNRVSRELTWVYLAE